MIPALNITTRKLCAPSKSAGQPPQPEIGRRWGSFTRDIRSMAMESSRFMWKIAEDLERSMKILWKMMVVVIS
jgi:hypothetical protein